MATPKGGRDKGAKTADQRRDKTDEPAHAFDLGTPEHGFMPKDKIMELVKRSDAFLKAKEGGPDADL